MALFLKMKDIVIVDVPKGCCLDDERHSETDHAVMSPVMSDVMSDVMSY